MKVLSLKEPFATLIKEKKKLVETRSWKTNYRGELYIHASLTRISKDSKEIQELMELVDNKELSFGYIVCKCNLVDCVYMTKEYVKNMKTNNYKEYICGSYEEGRYAWILEDIEPLEKPIRANGQLGIWNYYSVNEIMEMMNNIEYGCIDRKKSIIDYEANIENYALMSPKEVIENKVGVCWDQVELERYYFKNMGFKLSTYYMCYFDEDMCPTHTFLVYEDNNKFYWFEHSWEIFRGVHEYKNFNSLINDIRCKFMKFYNFKNEDNLIVYKYDKPKYGLNATLFMEHCESGERIN